MNNLMQPADNQMNETELWQAIRQFLDYIHTQIAALSDRDRQTLAALTFHELYILPPMDLDQIPESVSSLVAQIERWPDWPSIVLRELGLSATDADRN